MNSETGEPAIQLERSGDHVWGAVRNVFTPTGAQITILFDHDGGDTIANWKQSLRDLADHWEVLEPELDTVLPGGLAKCQLDRIDFRGHLHPSQAVLHFRTAAQGDDWYVRISKDWAIQQAGVKD